jgi:hypothetical protein
LHAHQLNKPVVTLATALDTSTHAQKREEGGEGGDGGDAADSLTGPHGAIACIAYLLFVVGAILMRVLNGPKVWLYHAATQSIGLLLAVVGAGMGIWIAMTTDQVRRSLLPKQRRMSERQ